MKYLFLTIFLNLVIYLIETYLDIRQYIRLKNASLPSCLNNYVTHKQFHDMKTYSLLRLSFTRLQSTFSFFIESIFLLFFLLPTLYSFSLQFNTFLFGWNTTNQVGNGITFLIFASGLSAALKLPFELYKLSVIDSKFAESTSETVKSIVLWAIHQIKALILALVIGVPLLSLILLLLNVGTAFHWSYIWMGSIAVSVVISELYPNLQPFFYEIEDFPQSDIRTRIEETIQQMGYPVKTIQVIKNSSSGANVLVTGSASGNGGNLRISIFQNVLEILNEDDLMAVLIHEFNHFISKDSLKELGIQIISMALYLFTLSRCIYDESFYSSFGFTDTTNPGIGLLLFSYFFQAFGSFISVITNIIHRQFEYNADIFAEENGYRIDEALIKMHVDNVFSMIVDKHYSRYYNSHPSLLERLENIALFRERKGKHFVFSPSTGDLIDLEEEGEILNEKELSESNDEYPLMHKEDEGMDCSPSGKFDKEPHLEDSEINLKFIDSMEDIGSLDAEVTEILQETTLKKRNIKSDRNETI